MSKNKKNLRKLADLLLEKEVIFSEDLETIFGKRPFASANEEDELVIDAEVKKELEKKKKKTTAAKKVSKSKKKPEKKEGLA